MLGSEEELRSMIIGRESGSPRRDSISRYGYLVCVCYVVLSFPTLQVHGLQTTRLLRPWNFPGKDTGVGCHFLLQGIFLTQGLNPCLLHLLPWQADSLPLASPGKLTGYLGKVIRPEFGAK